MGKTVLILIVVVTAIFATITLTIQKRTGDIPETLQEDIDEIHAKDLGGYALNYGIRQFNQGAVNPNPSYTQLFDGQDYPNFNVMNGSINSISYDFIDQDSQDDSLKIEAVVVYGSVVDTSVAIISNVLDSFDSEIGDWSMNDGNGVHISDGNENGNDGTLINAAPGQAWTSGRFGSAAINLDGWNDRIDLSGDVTSQYNEIMTVACWAKLDPSFLDWGTLVAEQTTSSGYPVVWTLRTRLFDIWIFQYVKYAFDVMTSGGIEEVSISKSNWQMDVYEWHFIVGVYDGTYSSTHAEITIHIYDEGYSESKIIPKWTSRDSTNVVSIGGRETNLSFFGPFTCIDGTIDEVKIFDHKLTNQELNNLYIYNGDPTTGIIYWKE